MMIASRLPAALLLALALLPSSAHAATAPQVLDHGRFKNVQLYTPLGAPKNVVLFLSGDGGWQAQEQLQAQALVDEGALVVGIDTPQFLKVLEGGSECVYPDGDLENLSHFMQAYARLPSYRAPVLVGDATGAALAFGVLAQAPTGTFSAGLVSDFCPMLKLRTPLCAGDGLQFEPLAAASAGVKWLPRPTLAAPFVAMRSSREARCDAKAVQSFIDAMPAARLKRVDARGESDANTLGRIALAAAFRSLTASAASSVKPAPEGLGDLPVIEQPAPLGSPDTRPDIAVFWSGDGGWAGLDQEVAKALNARGISVVGVDSLRYFWQPRTPEAVAADIEKISRHYLKRWQKSRVMLIGYSQGADVLPFAVNRLSADIRKRVALVATMGLSERAVFEFQLSNWVADNDDGLPTLPEIAKIKDLPFLCIYGEDDADSVCPQLRGDSATAVELPGGHHFDGDYAKLAAVILGALPK